MGCNSDYLKANDHEKAMSKVACLLDELAGLEMSASYWDDGYHPKIYNKGHDYDPDAMVSELCNKLRETDVTKYSLEMQIWWRDHQAADKARLDKELSEKRTAADRKAALAKLSDYEIGLLGLSKAQTDVAVCCGARWDRRIKQCPRCGIHI